MTIEAELNNKLSGIVNHIHDVSKKLSDIARDVDGLKVKTAKPVKPISKDEPRKRKLPEPPKEVSAEVKKSEGKPSKIGMLIHYSGIECRLVERKGNKFTAEAQAPISLGGKKKPKGWRFPVSATYVYNQMKKAAEPEAKEEE
jgi:hypothetical protein